MAGSRTGRSSGEMEGRIQGETDKIKGYVRGDVETFYRRSFLKCIPT